MSDPTILYPVSNTSREEFLAERKKQKYFITGMRFFILIFILAGWEIAARYHLIDAFIFSSPTRIFKVMLQMAADKSLFYHIGITIGETLVSFVLVLIIGTLIAMLLWWCRSAADILEPYFVVLNSLPKTALAPILIVWLGNNMKTIIVCGVTMAVFSTIINLYTRLRGQRDLPHARERRRDRAGLVRADHAARPPLAGDLHSQQAAAAHARGRVLCAG